MIRGLHFQLAPYSQGKLIRVLNGEIFDVFVDLRRDSKTFKSWGGVILNNTNRKQVWIPNGFAHGFLSLKDQTEVSYKVDNYYDTESERGIKFSDDFFSLDLGLSLDEIIISESLYFLVQK